MREVSWLDVNGLGAGWYSPVNRWERTADGMRCFSNAENVAAGFGYEVQQNESMLTAPLDRSS
jgi:hypothetical protein